MREEPLLNFGQIGAFELEMARGGSFSSNAFEGKYSILYFMFTSCKGPCPVNTKEVVEALNKYKNRDDLQIISISVDPETDTAARLAEYKNKFAPNENRWKLLRGDKSYVKNISNEILNLSLEDDPNSHSPRFVLIGPNKNIRAFLHRERLLTQLKEFL